MKCSRCAREIPDGSRFCGLCGGKQGDLKAETLVGGAATAALAVRGRAQTLVGGLAPTDVVGGGRRFAALSAGPASAPPRDAGPGPGTGARSAGAQTVTDTLSEGVPAGAMAALLAARRTQSAPQETTENDSAVPASAAMPVRSPAATLVGSPLRLPRAAVLAVGGASDVRTDDTKATDDTRPTDDTKATAQQRPSIGPHAVPADDTAESLPPAPADFAASTQPNLPAANPALASNESNDKAEQSLPPAAPDLVAALDESADRLIEARPSASDGAITMKRPRRVRPVVSEIPSVIVDSEFDREAQAAVAVLSKPPAAAPATEMSAPPADVEPEPVALTKKATPTPVDSAKPAGGGFRETAWFLDALDADALSRAESDDIQVRQAQIKAGVDRADQLDESTRRQYSLRSNHSLPALDKSAPTLADDAPDAVSRPSPLIGLLIFVVLALGVAGWFLFGR